MDEALNPVPAIIVLAPSEHVLLVYLLKEGSHLCLGYFEDYKYFMESTECVASYIAGTS